jgi:hypothetical protein
MGTAPTALLLGEEAWWGLSQALLRGDVGASKSGFEPCYRIDPDSA